MPLYASRRRPRSQDWNSHSGRQSSRRLQQFTIAPRSCAAGSQFARADPRDTVFATAHPTNMVTEDSIRRSRRVFAAALFVSILLFGRTFKPDDVKILGDLEYGQTSDPVDVSGSPRYRAFVFSARGGDAVEIRVTGPERKAAVSIADGGLNELATGTTHLAFTVPNHGPDAEAYYILFRDSEDQPARFTVELKRMQRAGR